MQRRWQVHPDETGTVSREALAQALFDGATMLDIAGGALYVSVGRQPTGLPGEMVLTGAILEWRDRTDAKEQPEQPVEPHGFKYKAETEASPPGAVIIDEQPGPSVEPDGFDYSKLEAEDVEEPQPAR